MEKKKQERAIVHLEKDGKHYYYGNLKALTDHWDKDAIGGRQSISERQMHYSTGSNHYLYKKVSC